jgi:DNA-binding transcriptional regulator YiaG
MKTTKARRKRSRVGRDGMTPMGREIANALREVSETLQAGIPLASRFTVRTVDFPDPPESYDAKAIRRTRDMIGVSQTLFARLLGVSPILVSSWEQGARVPALWARRLLDEMNHDPQRWRGMLRRAS